MPQASPAATENIRLETDTMGEVPVPADKYWGAQTQRSIQNFKISGEKMPVEVVHAFATLKKSAALVNADLGLLERKLANAISEAAMPNVMNLSILRCSFAGTHSSALKASSPKSAPPA